MRRALLVLLAVFACESAMAYSSATMTGIVKTSSGYAVKSGTVSNGVAAGLALVGVAGKTVSMPTTAALASNAPSVLMAAMRLTPTNLVVGLAATWLLDYSLSYTNGQWMRTATVANTSGMTWLGLPVSSYGGSSVETSRQACIQGKNANYVGATTAVSGDYTSRTCRRADGTTDGHSVSAYCSNGMQNVGGWPSCGPALSSNQPATEAEQAAPANATSLPDAVANEVAPKLAEGLPVQTPTIPASVRTPIGAPYVDPVTGQTKQPMVQITPSPTAEDPMRVDVKPYEQNIGTADPAAADPLAEPAAEEKPEDPCLTNPDRLGCLESGTPDDSELPNQAVNFAVNPVAVGGAGSCPANKTFSHAGQSYTFSYAPICNGATLMKPVVLALAWLLAAYIIVGTMKDS